MKYKLYKGDCLKMMDKLIEEGIKVDMILTDPPYGTTACKWDIVIPFNKYIVIKEGKKDKILYKDEFMLRKFKEGINIKEAEKEWEENSKEGMWDKLNKLIKPNGAICLFGSEPFSGNLRVSNIKNYKYDWYWNKTSVSGFANAKKMPLKNIETISIFYKKLPTYNPQGLIKTKPKINKNSKTHKAYGIKGGSALNGGRFKDEYIQEYTNYPRQNLIFSIQKGLHPSQKPVPLLEYLIKTYTNEGELVLDFTMGSGSTGVACLNTNRRFIGIELDENYFNIAKKRIEDTEEELNN